MDALGAGEFRRATEGFRPGLPSVRDCFEMRPQPTAFGEPRRSPSPDGGDGRPPHLRHGTTTRNGGSGIIYERWFEDVVKWLYALGMPSSDTEDLAQEIFLVVRRKLNRFDGGNLAGWLYRIAQLTVRDHRRRTWFKNLAAAPQRRPRAAWSWPRPVRTPGTTDAENGGAFRRWWRA